MDAVTIVGRPNTNCNDVLMSQCWFRSVGKDISWVVQAALGASGYVTVEDLADRWNTPAAARENGLRDLVFQDDGFNAQTSAFTAMRLLQAVRVAAQLSRASSQLVGLV